MKLDLELLRKIAEGASYRDVTISPRSVYEFDRIEKGEDVLYVAMESTELFLGWEISGWIVPGRGDVLGPDAAFLSVATPTTILALIDQIETLKNIIKA